MREFLSDLKRRQVFRVALAYTAIAWMVLEVADLVFPVVGFPDWSLKLVLVISALGFPVALVLAWTFDLTRDGVVVTPPASEQEGRLRISAGQIIQILLVGILVTLVGYLYVDRLTLIEKTEAPSSGPSSPVMESIAVLPFVNMSADADNEYFSDGISEELLHALANVRGLRVASRTSSFYFKGSNEDITDISAHLGVATVLEGSVRKFGNKVRITAQLINSSDGYHLWSGTYDGTLDNIFTLQNEIARQVVLSITPMLKPADAPKLQRPTESVEAYELYLLGRNFLRQPLSDEVLSQAITQFESAIEQDPAYTQAYAGLCQAQLALFTHNRDAEAFDEAEKACNRARTRQGDSLEVLIAQGALYREAGEYPFSIQTLEQASSQHPESVVLLQELGLSYAAAGAEELAEAQLHKAIEIDSADWDSHLILGNFYQDRQEYDKALESFERVLDLVPNYSSALIGAGAALYMSQREDEAEKKWREARDNARDSDTGSLGVAYTNLGLKHYYDHEFDKAAAMQLRAIELLPDNHGVWGRLAESRRWEGKPEEADQAYQTAIKLAKEELTRNHNDWNTLGLLGIYQAFQGEHQAAVTSRERMLEQAPQEATALYYAALISWAAGNTEQALAELEAARAQNFSSRMIASDPDLESLRQQEPARFEQLLEKTAH